MSENPTVSKAKPAKAPRKAVTEATEAVLDTLSLAGPTKDLAVAPADDAADAGPPPITSPDWTPYVLSRLDPDEVFDGCPTYGGLRRVCDELLGVVIDTDVHPAQSPNVQNGNHSAVRVALTIAHPVEYEWLGRSAGLTIRYADCSDVFSANGGKGEEFFSWVHSLATCTTRTKARVLRDAFRLRGVHVREELSEAQPGDAGTEGAINANQVRGLELICSRLGINAAKHIRDTWRGTVKNQPDEHYQDLNAVPYFVAAKAVGGLQKWQQKDNHLSIPAELKGYDPQWKAGLQCCR
jgi:hypothetical protein